MLTGRNDLIDRQRSTPVRRSEYPTKYGGKLRAILPKNQQLQCSEYPTKK